MSYTHVTVYLRVSSTEQTKGTGLEGQRLDVDAMARHLGVTIDTELVEGGRSVVCLGKTGPILKTALLGDGIGEIYGTSAVYPGANHREVA